MSGPTPCSGGKLNRVSRSKRRCAQEERATKAPHLHGAQRLDLLPRPHCLRNDRPLALDDVELNPVVRVPTRARSGCFCDRDDIVSCGCKAHPSAGSGVRMSENMMTPSGLKARHGWRWWARCVGGQLLERLLWDPSYTPVATARWQFQASLTAYGTGTSQSTCSERRTA